MGYREKYYSFIRIRKKSTLKAIGIAKIVIECAKILGKRRTT